MSGIFEKTNKAALKYIVYIIRNTYFLLKTSPSKYNTILLAYKICPCIKGPIRS